MITSKIKHAIKLKTSPARLALALDVHVKYVLSQCAQRMYVLKLLKHQGMPLDKLHVVTHSLIVSLVTYALPSWRGFVSAELISMIDGMLRRLKRLWVLKRQH